MRSLLKRLVVDCYVDVSNLAVIISWPWPKVAMYSHGMGKNENGQLGDFNLKYWGISALSIDCVSTTSFRLKQFLASVQLVSRFKLFCRLQNKKGLIPQQGILKCRLHGRQWTNICQCRYSRAEEWLVYFETMFRPNMMESKERVVKVPNCSIFTGIWVLVFGWL